MAQSVLSDGFVSLCISTDANFYAAPPRFVVEAQANFVEGVLPDKAYTINSELDVAALFEPGSIMFESLMTIINPVPGTTTTSPASAASGTVTIIALPRADATGAIAAEYDLPITGPAASDGTISLFIGNSQYAIAIPVDDGDTVATMATNAQALFSANFPYIVTTTATGLHFKAKNGGSVGNNMNAVVNWQGERGIMPLGVTVGPLTQGVQGSGDPVAPDYQSILGECCNIVYSLGTSSLAWQTGLRDWIRAAWDCSEPQCFGAGYTYREGTTGSIIASFDNSAELSVMACNPADIAFGWQKVAAYAGLTAQSTAFHPELNVQGQTDGLLTAIAVPANCQRYWTPDEYTLLQQNGFVTDGPVTQGGGTLTNIYVYNDVTEWLYDELYRPNATFRAASSRRLATATALQIATYLQTYNGLSVYYKNTKIQQGVFGTNKNLMLAGIQSWAKGQVGILFGEFDNIQTDITLTSSFDTSPPCVGVPGVFQLNLKYRAPARISNIGVALVPELLDNCIR